jgi:Zn-dependent M28 family amino/carboxypeptidase
VITLSPNPIASSEAARGARGGPGAAPGGGAPAQARPDLTTYQHVDRPIAPTITADETFFDLLFGSSSPTLSELRARAAAGGAASPIALPAASVTIAVNNTYELLSLDLTENVVGMVEGTDPVLKDTYVFFGAHLDHVGYATGSSPKGQVNTPLEQDRIWNGADDDGSGSSAVLAIAKAFVTGPKPKRSVVFIWHAGEEAGLVGSTYMAENPVVPLDRVQVELNIDMIGRNRDNDPAQANTVYVIGADRISTDLHNLLVSENNTLPAPLKLDFEYNDADDPNSFYTRSDHYSYASKGIPIAFFFTGTHPDYHANTDTVDKILFPKLVRIAQYVYEAGFSIANTDRMLVRDNRGPRSGRGFSGLLPR